MLGPMETARPFAAPVKVPLAITIGGLVLGVACGSSRSTEGFANAGGVLYATGLLYFLVQTSGRFLQRQWRAGLVALGRIVLLVLALFPAGVMTMLTAPSEDGFADGLTIPPGLQSAEPQPRPQSAAGGDDTFQKALLDALGRPASGDSSIIPRLPSLRALERGQRPLLLRHLASSAAWRLFEEDGRLCATRRWRLGGMWRWTLHGYYTSFDVAGAGPFQARVTVGLDGKPWQADTRGATRLDEGGGMRKLGVSERMGGVGKGSYCIIRCGGMVVEVYEESSAEERRLTKASIREVEAEFNALLRRVRFDRNLLPPGSVRRGKPDLDVYRGMQTGIYEVAAWVNPGESGMAYLKAFEVTRNQRLSEDRLAGASNERTGWSEDPEELFTYNTNVTIYEGDWGKPYAARFELWFKPDSGKTERRLLLQALKIEGWQR